MVRCHGPFADPASSVRCRRLRLPWSTTSVLRLSHHISPFRSQLSQNLRLLLPHMSSGPLSFPTRSLTANLTKRLAVPRRRNRNLPRSLFGGQLRSQEQQVVPLCSESLEARPSLLRLPSSHLSRSHLLPPPTEKARIQTTQPPECATKDHPRLLAKLRAIYLDKPLHLKRTTCPLHETWDLHRAPFAARERRWTFSCGLRKRRLELHHDWRWIDLRLKDLRLKEKLDVWRDSFV